MRVFLLLCFSVSVGCAGSQRTLSEADRAGLRERAAASHNDRSPQPRKPRRRSSNKSIRDDAGLPTDATVLPSPPSDALWSDGRSDSQAGAVRQARRQVSEQVVAQLSSESQTVDSSFGGQERSDAQLKVRIKSQFRHAELIRTVGVIRDGKDFVARVTLDRREAIEAYSRDMAARTAEANRIAATLEQALDGSDAAVLLARKWSLRHIYEDARADLAVLAALGERRAFKIPTQHKALMTRAAKARSKAALQIVVDGNAPETLQRAVLGAISNELAKNHCKLGAEPVSAVEQVRPAAIVRLRVRSRDHREFGTLWRYVGFELYAVDARSGSPITHVSALPEFVHGGGPNWPMADQAVIRRLGAKLAEKFGQDLAKLNCR